MLELAKDELETLIKENDEVIVKFWAKDCPNCITYAPIFANLGTNKILASHEFETYKAVNKFLGAGLKALPATVKFKDGKPVDMQFGKLDKAVLFAFIEDGSPAVDKIKVTELRAQICELMTEREQIQARIQKIDERKDAIWNEINRRTQNA